MGISYGTSSVRKIGKTRIINRINANGQHSETRITATNTSGATKTYNRVTVTQGKPKFYPTKTVTNNSSSRSRSYNPKNEMSSETAMFIFYIALGLVLLPFVLIYWAWKMYKEHASKSTRKSV